MIASCVVVASAANATSYPPKVAFFALRSARLSSDERAKLIHEVADFIRWMRSSGYPVGCIQIDGHADRSGSPAQNVKLSLARAQTAREELRRAGLLVAPARVGAFGEERLRNETADGVAERSNRRVEVMVQSACQA
jgi:outer membrane protein OmpA-like peptidoglycan-associated protein